MSKLYKFIFIIFLVLFIPKLIKANIVSNQSTSEDSLVLTIVLLDSLGNPANLSADSFYISVIGPSGDSVYTNAGIAQTSGLNIDSTIHTLSGKKYIYNAAISSIDGLGRSGIYELTFCVKNNASSLISCRTINFQLIETSLNDRLTELESIYDSIKNYDNWIARESSLNSLDSSNISGWVWNSPKSNHNINGTFGDNLDAKISGISSGSGVYSYEILAIDSINDLTLSQINIAVRNLDQTSLLAVGVTDSDGRVTLNLNNGTYLVIAGASGYQFNSFDTIIVSSNSSDTLYGSLFNPATPVDPSLCRVYGYVSDIMGGDLSELDIRVTLPDGAVKFNNLIIAPYEVRTTTDSTGYFEIDLIPTGLLSPTDQKYELSISRHDGIILRKKITVPVQSTWLLDW